MLQKHFPNLSEQDAEILSQFMRQRQPDIGTVLIEQNSHTRDLFVLLEGRLKVFQKATLAKNVCALELAQIEAPCLIGETALLCDQPRTATVVAASACTVWEFKYADLEALMTQHPAIAIEVLNQAGKTVAERFIALQDKYLKQTVAQAEDVRQAVALLSKYIGNVSLCSKETAYKLFGI